MRRTRTEKLGWAGLVMAGLVAPSACVDDSNHLEPAEPIVVESRPVMDSTGVISVKVTSNRPVDLKSPIVLRVFDLQGNVISESEVGSASDVLTYGPAIVTGSSPRSEELRKK